MTETTTLTPLQQTVRLGTDLWNDSSDPAELEYAIANGAVGATSNPPITLDVLRREPDHWRDRTRELYASFPTWTESQISWQVYEEIALRGAAVLLPTFERSRGVQGRLSIQTDPALYRDTDRMLEQGLHFAGLAPNLQVKFPTTRAGLVAIEEATYRGVTINATVSFTVAQALAVGEAIERALERRAIDGLSSELHPVCTIMVGRLDDWMKVVAERDGLSLTPGVADWAGVAAFKRAYELYRERGFRTRLLAAAYRHHLHWSQLIGGDVVLSMPHAWQVRFNASSVEVRPRIDDPVDPAIVRELLDGVPDFGRAYEPDGMAIDGFDDYGPTVRTLRQFIAASHDLVAAVRDFVLPNPDTGG